MNSKNDEEVKQLYVSRDLTPSKGKFVLRFSYYSTLRVCFGRAHRKKLTNGYKNLHSINVKKIETDLKIRSKIIAVGVEKRNDVSM